MFWYSKFKDSVVLYLWVINLQTSANFRRVIPAPNKQVRALISSEIDITQVCYLYIWENITCKISDQLVDWFRFYRPPKFGVVYKMCKTFKKYIMLKHLSFCYKTLSDLGFKYLFSSNIDVLIFKILSFSYIPSLSYNFPKFWKFHEKKWHFAKNHKFYTTY